MIVTKRNRTDIAMTDADNQANPSSVKKFNPIPWAAALMLLMLVGYYVARKAQTHAEKSTQAAPLPASLPAGSVAPEFSLPALQGGTARLSDYKGKLVFLNFWATWCPPCKKEIPDFIELERRYAAQGLQIVGIAVDEPDQVRAFVEQSKINYPVLFGNDEVGKRYGGIESIPTTFVIDQTGAIQRMYVGWQPPATWEAEINKYL
jgi:peroxiredoxin